MKLERKLNKAIALIDSESLAGEFLENILTPVEREEISRRLEIFTLLQNGMPQRAIAEKLNVSIATVTRGSRELKYGNHGIQRVLRLLEKTK